jgi:hypothetical protein
MAASGAERKLILELGCFRFSPLTRPSQGGMFPIWFAKFPECAADRVEPGGRHVHRAEPAMAAKFIVPNICVK